MTTDELKALRDSGRRYLGRIQLVSEDADYLAKAGRALPALAEEVLHLREENARLRRTIADQFRLDAAGAP